MRRCPVYPGVGAVVLSSTIGAAVAGATLARTGASTLALLAAGTLALVVGLGFLLARREARLRDRTDTGEIAD
jgi:hypothetical protein